MFTLEKLNVNPRSLKIGLRSKLDCPSIDLYSISLLSGIIPDENYEDFLNLVNAPTQVIQEFVGKYSMPFYVDFLQFIMRHLIKIWKLDYELSMATINQRHSTKPYETERVVDKLVAIFKQLIFR